MSLLLLPPRLIYGDHKEAALRRSAYQGAVDERLPMLNMLYILQKRFQTHDWLETRQPVPRQHTVGRITKKEQVWSASFAPVSENRAMIEVLGDNRDYPVSYRTATTSCVCWWQVERMNICSSLHGWSYGDIAGPLRTRGRRSLEDDVPRLVPRLDVPRRFDHLLQRVGPIDDRSVLPGLDKLLEQDDVLLRVSGYSERHPLVADPPGQQDQERTCHRNPRSVSI